MELSKITDVNQLKAMAYDQINAMETAQELLKAINRRIAEVQTPLPKAEETTTTTAAPDANASEPTGEKPAETAN